MKGKIILAANAIMLTIFAACAYEADPAPTLGVDVFVVANGVKYSPEVGTIPADTDQVHVVADVTAPPGSWPLTLTVDGALSFKGQDAGAVSSTVYGAIDGGQVELQFAASPQPTGEAVVRASLGGLLTKNFRFVVAPVVPRISICEASTGGEDAGCVLPAGTVTDPGPPIINDKVEWLPLPVSAGALRDGDRVVLQISSDVLPTQQGVSWTGTVATDGVLWLVNGDTNKRTLEINFKQGSGPILVPARVIGSGAGSASASIGGSPSTPLFIETGTASVRWRRIEFIEHVGLGARNRVSLCSSRLSGSLRLSLDLDGGAVSPSQVSLNLTPGGPCVDPYPSQADIIWTGSQVQPFMTVWDNTSDASTLIALPTLGTETVSSLKDPPDVTVSWLNDGGADAAPDAKAVVEVSGILLRNVYGQTGGKPTEPVGNADLNVTAPGVVTVSPSSAFKTDANGHFSFEVSIPVGLPAFSVLLQVDHLVTVPILIKP